MFRNFGLPPIFLCTQHLEPSTHTLSPFVSWAISSWPSCWILWKVYLGRFEARNRLLYGQRGHLLSHLVQTLTSMPFTYCFPKIHCSESCSSNFYRPCLTKEDPSHPDSGWRLSRPSPFLLLLFSWFLLWSLPYDVYSYRHRPWEDPTSRCLFSVCSFSSFHQFSRFSSFWFRRSLWQLSRPVFHFLLFGWLWYLVDPPFAWLRAPYSVGLSYNFGMSY